MESVKQIQAKHWSEQRICGHFRTRSALLRVRGSGAPQIRETCADCGKAVGPAEPRKNHPNAGRYPFIIPHPKPCECHSTERPTPRQIDYAAYLASPEWQQRRAYYYAKALFRCELCGWESAAGSGGRGLNVHHRTYARLGREFDADVIVLCRDCHAKFHDVVEAAA